MSGSGDRAQRTGAAGELSLRSEFGWAVVGLDEQANGPRLRIHSPRSGRTVLLDPLEVESLAQWRHDDLVSLVLGRAYAEPVTGDRRVHDGDEGRDHRDGWQP